MQSNDNQPRQDDERNKVEPTNGLCINTHLCRILNQVSTDCDQCTPGFFNDFVCEISMYIMSASKAINNHEMKLY